MQLTSGLRFAIDSGGTATRLALAEGGRPTVGPLRYGSANPASVGGQDALDPLRSALDQVAAIASRTSGCAVTGVIASAAISPGTLGYWRTIVADLLRDAGLTGSVVLTNDIDALVVAPPVSGAGGVIVAGTGSGAMIVADRRVVRVGGWEYLASDEGGAFWLGRAGLAAAVRAADGRGAATAVSARIESHHARPVGDVARMLAELPHPRQAVAGLARCVTDAWLADGDDVAAALVTTAVAELAQLASAGIARIGGPPPTWALTGGLAVECPQFARLVMDALASLCPDAAVHLVSEPVLLLLQVDPTVEPECATGSPGRLVRTTITLPA